MSDLWMDLSDLEAENRLQAVAAVRIATASLWPILAGAVDRDDFANRLELVRGRIAEAAKSEEVLRAVEASLVNDFETLLRKEAEVSEKKRKDAEKKGDTLPGTDKFPIENKKDLENAKHDIGRTNEPKAKVERYINEQAKELGAPGIGGKESSRGLPRCPLCGKGPDTDEHFDAVHLNEEVPEHWSSHDWDLQGHHQLTTAKVAADQRPIRTADGAKVGPGDRVFDYYNGHWGHVGDDIDHEGWFTHHREDGSGRCTLNGERVCQRIPAGNPFFKTHGGKDGLGRSASLESEGRETSPFVHESANAITDEDISDAYENKHIPWSQEHGYDPDTIQALREHEKSRGISRRMADGIADLTGIGGGGPDWRSGHHYEAALADVPVGSLPTLNHLHTDHITDDELMAHLRHEHGLNIQPYRHSNEHSHSLDHLLAPFGDETGPSHDHGGQFDFYLDSPIKPIASKQEVEEAGEKSAARTAATNLYEPEYEEGLECPHSPYCNWKGFSEAKRQEHLKNRHGGSMPGAKKSASVIDQVTLDAVADAGLFGAEVKALPAGEPRRSFLSRMFRRAKNDENLMEKCPICGKEIPAAEMANHMKKEHPHQAIKPEDINRANEHAHHHGGTGMQNEHIPNMDGSNKENQLLPLPTINDSDQGLSPMQEMSLPSNMNPKTSARLDLIEKIALDLYTANPGLTEPQRISLATQTVDRYPQLLVQARGGADYVDGETLTLCTQCQKPTFSEASHHCHNCGFVKK